MKLSSKAETLERLYGVLDFSNILPLYRFDVALYKEDPSEIIENIQTQFSSEVIVRSSSVNEDNTETSNAGGFDSVMNVDTMDNKVLIDAIEQVIKSYGSTAHPLDQIFVQPMLKDVSMSGVIFSSDIDTLSPYYIINYDESGSTDSVTSGVSNNLKNFICFKAYDTIENRKLKQLVQATKECEVIFNNKYLDIEFAFSNDVLYILQVRAIVTQGKEDLSHVDLSCSLEKLNKKIKKLNAPHPNLLGDKTIFGVMPDWNPAEIIGIRPKGLALSLYKELITDETWAYQRDNYGYRNLRSHPLLVSFLGVPFIDVRISFNSFIPKKLDEDIASKLVNYYLDQLTKNVNHHDKVEFEIIFSCYFFGLETSLLKLKKFGFYDKEIESIKMSLLELTNPIIAKENGLYKKDLEKVALLEDKFNVIVNSQLSLIDKIYWMIQDVKRYGTLPFAGVARSGFIAVQILKSLVTENILTPEEYDSFLNVLNTVSKELSCDINSLDKVSFLTKYGHLRPGTYDIVSPRYDEAYDDYFTDEKVVNTTGKDKFEFSQKQKQQIEQLILDNKLDTDFENLIVFIKESIEGREWAKFVFTKHLSQVLKYVEEFGIKFGFSKEELAYLDIQKIINLYATLDHRDVKEILKTDIEKNKDFYTYTKAIKLPSVIVDPDDIYSFFLEENEANFVTLKKIKSIIVMEGKISKHNIENKIVCITSADPGYDYLFSKNIGGLITCYGGANSHMAIRCAEMGIPAVIGCGEHNFHKYSQATHIEIDALNKQVKIIS
jgi:phosphohistidine swiveling domain-containing protein